MIKRYVCDHSFHGPLFPTLTIIAIPKTMAITSIAKVVAYSAITAGVHSNGDQVHPG